VVENLKKKRAKPQGGGGGLSRQEQNNTGRDSSVGIATRYGLDGPGIESRWLATFSAPVQTGPGTNPDSYTMGTGSFPGVKQPERGVNYPHHLASRLMKEYSCTSTPSLGLRGQF